MLLHRLVGAFATTAGVLLLVSELFLLYAPVSMNFGDLIFRLGIPGVLVIGLFAMSSIAFGFWFAAAPVHAVQHVKALHLALTTNKNAIK